MKTFNWQKNGWPGAKVNRAALREELAAFAVALQRVKTAAEKPISQMTIANALVDEPMNEPIDDGINDGINGEVLRLIAKNPGKRVPAFMAKLELSRPTVERAIAVLIKAGKIEHRGSKKTGGYWKI